MSRIGEWTYEAPDHSVGLFGGGWIHEDCPEWEDELVSTIEEQLATTTNWSNGLMTIWCMLTCEACVQQILVTDNDFNPDYWMHNVEEKAHALGEEHGK